MPRVDFKYTKEDLYREMAEALQGAEQVKNQKPAAIQNLLAKAGKTGIGVGQGPAVPPASREAPTKGI